jgi:group I intron endonuclease
MEPIRYIYKTTNTITGKSYIGSHLCRKPGYIKSYLGSGTALKCAIKKYGKENFTKEILEYYEHDNPRILETKYIKQFKTLVPNGYNISKSGGTGLITQEVRNKLVKGRIGKTHTKETKEKIANHFRGIKLPQETLDRMSASLTGQKRTKKQKENISKSLKGKVCRTSEYHPSEETKRKIGLSNKGRKVSEETKNKLKGIRKGISPSNRGVLMTEEQRKKVSEGTKKWHELRKLNQPDMPQTREIHT